MEARRQLIPRGANQPSHDERCEAAENRYRQVVPNRHAGRARLREKQLTKERRQRAEIRAENSAKKRLHYNQRFEGRMDLLGLFSSTLFGHELAPRRAEALPLRHQLPPLEVCIATLRHSHLTPLARCIKECLEAGPLPEGTLPPSS